MMDFNLKLMDFDLKLVDFVLKTDGFVLNMMEFVLKMHRGGSARRLCVLETGLAGAVIEP